MNRSQAIVLISVLLAGCVSTAKLFPSDVSEHRLNIPGRIDSIEFVDSRRYVSSEADIELPVFSKPGQLIHHVPQLIPAHQEILVQLIRQNFADEGEQLGVVVEVIEGTKVFSATWAKEIETVKIRLKITLIADSSTAVTEAFGEYTVSSLDAKYERFERMYRSALMNVTLKALEKLKMKEH